MNRQGKEKVIERLKGELQKSEAAFLVGCKGLNVAQVSDLRSKLREKGGAFKVAKLTLMRRAVSDVSGVSGLEPFLKDQLAFVFAEKESPAIAKVLDDFAKENQQFQILAGTMESNVLSAESIKTLAALPSKEVLLAQVLSTMQAPVSGLARVCNMLILRLLYVLKEIEKTKN